MGTSTLRFAIIVALVVGGVLLIGQAFPEAESGSLPRPTEPATPTDGESPEDRQTEQPDGDQTTPPPGKVVVGVYNGTFVAGLAGTTATQLSKKERYRVPDAAVGDAPSKPVNETTVYYRTPGDEAAARALVRDYFAKRDLPGVAIERMQPDLDVPDTLDLAIFIGTDLV